MGIRARFLMPNRGGGASYSDKVLGYSPIAYWMLAEASGTDAICQVNAAQNGSHTGVTLGQPGIGDGETCPFYDGANDYTGIWTAALEGAFNGDEGTFHVWLKMAGGSVWTDAAGRMAFFIKGVAGGGENWIRLEKPTTNNTLKWSRYGTSGLREVTKGSISTTDWMALGLTWSLAADELTAYFAGAQTGATQTGLLAWNDATLQAANCVIGAETTAPWAMTHGYLAHCAVFDTALALAAMEDLAVIP